MNLSEQVNTGPDAGGAAAAARAECQNCIFLGNSGYFLPGGALVIYPGGKQIPLPLPVTDDGLYRVEFKPVYTLMQGDLKIGVDPKHLVAITKEVLEQDHKGPWVNLGTATSRSGVITLTIAAQTVALIHQIKLIRMDH